MPQQTSAAAVYSSEAIVEALLPLGTGGADDWFRIPGANSVEVDNGERPTNEAETFEGTVVQDGQLTKPTITVGFGSYLPHSQVIRQIVEYFQQGQFLTIRWTYPPRIIVPMTSGSKQIDIATDGTATPSGFNVSELKSLASSRVPENSSLFTGAVGSQKDYLIQSKAKTADGQLSSYEVIDGATFGNPNPAVNDANFGIRVPQVRRPSITTIIMDAGDESGATGQAGLTSSLVLRSIQDLPPVEIISN